MSDAAGVTPCWMHPGVNCSAECAESPCRPAFADGAPGGEWPIPDLTSKHEGERELAALRRDEEAAKYAARTAGVEGHKS